MEAHIENELGPKKRPDLVAFIPFVTIPCIPFLKNYYYNTILFLIKDNIELTCEKRKENGVWKIWEN